jgi:hypothetical protein
MERYLNTDGLLSFNEKPQAFFHVNNNQERAFRTSMLQSFERKDNRLKLQTLNSTYLFEVDPSVTNPPVAELTHCQKVVNDYIKSLKEHLSSKYSQQQGSGFFCFDGEKYLKDGTMRYWVFGHTHDAIEYNYEGVHCICHPLGSPIEDNGSSEYIKTIEITNSIKA